MPSPQPFEMTEMNTTRLAAHAPHSLYDQLSDTARECIALLLGFSSCEHAAGFHVALTEIVPLRDGFTIGEAFQAYVAHIAKRISPSAPSVV
ncbi:hypothetical protein NOV72_05750 [Caballeronia novacaledonica]|uniref:Uncharacterized protein n=1 Tax=Caballeronia novacaledonica TaxID=1544861 RepID=A0A2U3IE91_9BURK|nr:hypothetical protein [Caballeronia novacaledonica]SPB18550.1 hypothetical protein NOV72_05750 [Caballeronia novacaledonica]